MDASVANVEERNSRTLRILGAEGLARLEKATVAVFGLGGVGSSCVEALARGGVGGFVVVDKDCVEVSNINRQAIAFASTVGHPKVDVMEKMIREINPDARVTKLQEFVRRENLTELMEALPHPDYMVDAFDTLTAKAAIALYADVRGISVVSAMGGANKLDPTKLAFANLYDTKVCPLCRELRKIGRAQGIRNLKVLYSCEQPVRVSAQAGAERSEKTELGTLSYFPPIMGQMIAGYVIRDIAGLPV